MTRRYFGPDPGALGGTTRFLREDATWQVPPGSGVPSTRNLTAGAGLTGGGDLSADRTFDVAANADGSLIVNANDIQVGVLATDAQHGNRGGGAIHAAATPSTAGFESAADKTKLDGLYEVVSFQSGTTTDATPTVVASYTPADGEHCLIWCNMIAKRTDGGAAQGKGNIQSYTFRRAGGTTTQIGAQGSHLNDEDVAAWDFAVGISGAVIQWTATGAAGATIVWKTRLLITKQ